MTEAAELFPSEKPEAFLEAWKRAIEISGHPRFFYDNSRIGLAGYAPKVKDITRALPGLPKSQAALITAMVSFYNPEEGAKLMTKTGTCGLGNLSMHLQDPARAVLGDLIFNYQGW